MHRSVPPSSAGYPLPYLNGPKVFERESLGLDFHTATDKSKAPIQLIPDRGFLS
jgi:hypothetical protein